MLLDTVLSVCTQFFLIPFSDAYKVANLLEKKMEIFLWA